jgi:hypothetical protein
MLRSCMELIIEDLRCDVGLLLSSIWISRSIHSNVGSKQKINFDPDTDNLLSTVAPLGSCYVRNRILQKLLTSKIRHFQVLSLQNYVALKLCHFRNALLPNITVIVAGSGDMRRSAPEDGCNNYSGLRGGPRLATCD